MKKIITSLVIIIMIALTVTNVIWADFDDPNVGFPKEDYGGNTAKLNNAIGSAWQTFVVVVQALAVGTVVFAGVRYMFAAPEQRADLKKGLAYLAIGAAFVFSATTITNFIINAASEVINK